MYSVADYEAQERREACYLAMAAKSLYRDLGGGAVELGKVIDIFAAIVTVALAAVIVGSPNTGGIISAFGNAFSGGLRAAKS